MAIMSRIKKANKRGWDQISSERVKSNEPEKKKEDKKITEEEHKNRIKLLRELGLLKEEN